ncbi:hypothetical protein R6Q59_028428 [Mikania micrantha]
MLQIEECDTQKICEDIEEFVNIKELVDSYLTIILADPSDGSSDSEVTSPDSDIEDHCYAYGDIPKLQFRKEGSKARWKEELGMAEIIKIGALQLLDDDDQCIPLEDIYKKVAKGVGGSSWESVEVYKHLKSLGYIIKRHGVCWTMKRAMTAPPCVTEIVELFSSMQINDVKPVF